MASRWLLLCGLLAGHAQASHNNWEGNGPEGGQIVEVAIAAGGNDWYAATLGGVFASNDGGLSWKRRELGLTSSSVWLPQIGLRVGGAGRLYAADAIDRLFVSDNGGNEWRATSLALLPQIGNAINDIAVSPTNADVLMVTTTLNGVQYSANGGGNFTPLSVGLPPLGTPFLAVAIDPANPNRAYIGTDGKLLSAADPMPAAIYLSSGGVFNYASSYTPPTPVAGQPRFYGKVMGYAFGPAASNVMWSVVVTPTENLLILSNSRGSSWASITSPVVKVLAVAAHPTNPDIAWAGGSNGVYVTNNRGLNWAPVNNGLQPTTGSLAEVRGLTVHPNFVTNPTLVAASGNGGIFVSSNGGGLWIASNDGLNATSPHAMTVLPADRQRIYAGYSGATSPSPGLFQQVGDVTASLDWAATSNPPAAYQIRALSIDRTTAASASSTRVYAAGAACLGLGNECFGPRNGGIYRSLNGGATWSTIDSGLPLNGSPPQPFPGVVRGLAINPRSCAVPPPMGPCAVGPLNTLAFAAEGRFTPTTPGNATHTFRVGLSGDAGLGWTDLTGNLPAPIDYASNNQQHLQPTAIAYSAGGVAFLGTEPILGTGVTTPNIVSGVFRDLGGGDWQPSNNGLPTYIASSTVRPVQALVGHPTLPGVLYASLAAKVDGELVSVYKSNDNGASWQVSNGGMSLPDVRAFAFDPVNPNVMYATGKGRFDNPGGVYKSIDGGSNWSSISISLPADAGFALVVDPNDSNLLHVGTNSGVYSLLQKPDGDRDGIPDAIEDLAPSGNAVLEIVGDGNGDGTLDKFQGDVGSSVVIYKALNAWNKAGAVPAPYKGTATGYFTTDVQTILSGRCQQAYDVHGVEEEDFPVDRNPYGIARSYPEELIRIEILDCPNANLVITYHGASFGAGMRMRGYGPTQLGNEASVRWYDASGFSTQIDTNTWQVNLGAGQAGSLRPEARDVLLILGPAYDDQIYTGTFEAPLPPD